MSVEFSRRVVRILRHNTEGLSMTFDGYINVSDILKHLGSHFKEADVERMVKNDSKKRFALQKHGKKLQIRATNGHTINVDLSMKPTKHKIGLHGTFMKNWENIKSQGLSRKGRAFIHMASRDPSCLSGIPGNRDMTIEIDIEKAKKDGIEFFESENGVIQSPGNSSGVIGKKYFIRAFNKFGTELCLD